MTPIETERLIRRHQPAAPVQMVTLTKSFGIRVFSARILDETKTSILCLDKERGGSSGYAMILRKDIPSQSKRYTIAHLLAHYILHKPFLGNGIIEDSLHRADDFSPDFEREANDLARDILMPWHLIRKAESAGIASIVGLADHFAVDRGLMAYRLLGTCYPEPSLSN